MSLSDGSRLQFVITSERYKQWEAARAGLSKSVVAKFGALLKPKAPTRQSIDRATAYLVSDAQTRQAIQRTGMSVQDFVLMTVALEQEMQLANGRGAASADAPVVADASPSPVDTAYALPNIPAAQVPVVPPPPPSDVADTASRRDTLVPPRRDSVVKRDTTRRRDSIRVDTTAPKADTTAAPRVDSTLDRRPLTDSIPPR